MHLITAAVLEAEIFICLMSNEAGRNTGWHFCRDMENKLGKHLGAGEGNVYNLSSNILDPLMLTAITLEEAAIVLGNHTQWKTAHLCNATAVHPYVSTTMFICGSLNLFIITSR